MQFPSDDEIWAKLQTVMVGSTYYSCRELATTLANIWPGVPLKSSVNRALYAKERLHLVERHPHWSGAPLWRLARLSEKCQ